MALILNGTDGLSDVDGSAATPAIRGTDANTGIFFPAADTIAFSEGGVEAARFDSAGNFGLGVTPSLNSLTSGALDLAGGAGLFGFSNQTELTCNAYYNSVWRYKATGFATLYQMQSGQHQWSTAASGSAGGVVTFTQAMTLDASGRLGIGETSPAQLLDLKSAATDVAGIRFQNTSTNGRTFVVGAVGSGGYFDAPIGSWSIRDSTAGATRLSIDSSGRLLVGYTSVVSGTPVGSVAAVGYAVKQGTGNAPRTDGNCFNIDWTGSAPQLWIQTTNLGTISISSDYRIKKNVETQTFSGIQRVMQLRPVKYEFTDYGVFKEDGVQREGFIAHELQAVIPSAVEGEKDAENQLQSLKLDALVSVLTKAIQEQQALITSLTARITALESA
jgi:hypothetical protein